MNNCRKIFLKQDYAGKNNDVPKNIENALIFAMVLQCYQSLQEKMQTG